MSTRGAAWHPRLRASDSVEPVELGTRGAEPLRDALRPGQRADIERWALFVIVPLLPLTVVGISTFSVGAALGLLLAPVGIRAAVAFRGALPLLTLWVLCLLAGPILAYITADELSRSLNQRLEIRLLLLMMNAGVSLYVLLWARSAVGLRATAALYAIGLIGEALSNQIAATAANPWKYAFALPVAVLLLALARNQAQSIIVLIGLAVFSVAEHSRSFAALSILTAIALLVMNRKSHSEGVRRTLQSRSIFFIALATVALYQLISAALLHGWLGSHLRDQAITQTRGGQVTLIVGARPEWAAGLELFESRPIGFGPGVVPNMADVKTGLSGLVDLGVNRENQYVEDYLFGSRLELHSVVGDLWLLFGFIGLALAATIIWILLSGLFGAGRKEVIGAITLLTTFLALWDMAFSPASNLRYVVLALALVMRVRATPMLSCNERESAL